MLQAVLQGNKDSQAYLTTLCSVKLFDKKTAMQEAADKIELANIVLDVMPDLSQDGFVEQLLAAIFYGQMLPHTSLFFFRCVHLERVLTAMAAHPKYSKERDFWLKSEDMILRQRD
jgi:hypothetical protein